MALAAFSFREEVGEGDAGRIVDLDMDVFPADAA
jgi:hypothetical protein